MLFIHFSKQEHFLILMNHNPVKTYRLIQLIPVSQMIFLPPLLTLILKLTLILLYLSKKVHCLKSLSLRNNLLFQEKKLLLQLTYKN